MKEYLKGHPFFLHLMTPSFPFTLLPWLYFKEPMRERRASTEHSCCVCCCTRTSKHIKKKQMTRASKETQLGGGTGRDSEGTITCHLSLLSSWMCTQLVITSKLLDAQPSQKARLWEYLQQNLVLYYWSPFTSSYAVFPKDSLHTHSPHFYNIWAIPVEGRK